MCLVVLDENRTRKHSSKCYSYGACEPSTGNTGCFTLQMGGLCLRNNDYGCKDNACANPWVTSFFLPN